MVGGRRPLAAAAIAAVILAGCGGEASSSDGGSAADATTSPAPPAEGTVEPSDDAEVDIDLDDLERLPAPSTGTDGTQLAEVGGVLTVEVVDGELACPVLDGTRLAILALGHEVTAEGVVVGDRLYAVGREVVGAGGSLPVEEVQDDLALRCLDALGLDAVGDLDLRDGLVLDDPLRLPTADVSTGTSVEMSGRLEVSVVDGDLACPTIDDGRTLLVPAEGTTAERDGLVHGDAAWPVGAVFEGKARLVERIDARALGTGITETVFRCLEDRGLDLEDPGTVLAVDVRELTCVTGCDD